MKNDQPGGMSTTRSPSSTKSTLRFSLCRLMTTAQRLANVHLVAVHCVVLDEVGGVDIFFSCRDGAMPHPIPHPQQRLAFALLLDHAQQLIRAEGMSKHVRVTPKHFLAGLHEGIAEPLGRQFIAGLRQEKSRG